VLSPAQQHSLYERSPYNVIRLELNEAHPGDSATDNPYTRARAMFETWFRQGALRDEDEAAFYLLKHRFQIRGRTHERTSLFTRLRAEDYSRRIVLPHEATLDGPKKDRLTLLETCRANFSPIMCLYRDPSGAVRRAEETVTARGPDAEFASPDGSGFRLWVVKDAGTIGAVRAAFTPLQLYIADGHHRYETGLAYRDRQREREGTVDTAERAWNFVLAALVDLDDPGLVVLPYHRVLGGLDATTRANLQERLHQLFEVRPVEPGKDGVASLVAAVEAPGTAPRIAVYGAGMVSGAGETALLVLREGHDLAHAGNLQHCEPWILQEQVLRPVLGDRLKEHVTYVHDARDAAAMVARGEAQMTFLLRAVPLDLFISIARDGERLPPKATYFYPKLPTGVVINRVED
jgi:uncharacterized protein (DUF1015 family)